MATTRVQAEDYDGELSGSNMAGMIAETTDTGGGDMFEGLWRGVGWYYSLALGSEEVDTIRLRYSCSDYSSTQSPNYTFRTVSNTGTVVGTWNVPSTGSASTWATSPDITLDPPLTGDVDFWFCWLIGNPGDRGTNLNWWEYDVDSATVTPTAVAAPAAVPVSGWATRNSQIVMGGASKSGTWT